MNTFKLTPPCRTLLEHVQDNQIVQFSCGTDPVYRYQTMAGSTGYGTVPYHLIVTLREAGLIVGPKNFSNLDNEPRFWRLTDAGRAALATSGGER